MTRRRPVTTRPTPSRGCPRAHSRRRPLRVAFAGRRPSPEVADYLDEVVRRLRAQLGDELVSVILAGSYATGDALAGVSDVDVAVVCEQPLADERKRSLFSVLR